MTGGGVEVAVPTESKKVTQPSIIFAGSHCDALVYRLNVKPDEFNAAPFLSAVSLTEKARGWFSVNCAPRNQSSDFHLHVSWRLAKRVDVNVEFIAGAIPPEPKEKEPYAEDFIHWLEPFFLNKKPQAELHADFKYSTRKWKLRFLLPLKAEIGPHKTAVEIDGFSFSFSDRPEGVAKVWLTAEPDTFYLHVKADRVPDLKRFDPKRDLAVISKVVETLLEERHNDGGQSQK